MKATHTLLLFVLLLVACSPGAPEPTATLLPETQEEAAAVVEAPTDTPKPEEPTTAAEPSAPTAVPTAEATAPAVAEPEEAAAAVEPEPVEASAVNGPYQGTYFRGSADAPVTMIDYSDFL
jgi:outer membrane biosynthesis protein TonB